MGTPISLRHFPPADMGAASGVYLRMVEEAGEKIFDQMTPDEKRRQAEFDYAVWAATSGVADGA